MPVHIVRLGTPRAEGEGLRMGTVQTGSVWRRTMEGGQRPVLHRPPNVHVALVARLPQ